MKDISYLLYERFRRSLKYFVKELKDRDDYEARMSQDKCIACGGDASYLIYRIIGQKEWEPAIKNHEINCKKCTEQKELAQILEGNKTCLNEQLASRFEKEYWHIPEDLKNAEFKNFYVEHYGSVYEAKRAAMDYVKAFQVVEKRHNLLIMGNPGTGKTHLATAIARTLKKQGYLVGHLTTGMLLSKIKATYQKGASTTEERILNDLKKFELLVLDDLGSEARNSDEFDWSKNKLFEIVNLRIGKPTIYTSNFNVQHLPTAIGERVYSRLYNNNKFIKLVTDDYRKKFKIE
ncbi:ATP-binding protein [Bacillus sp. ISL-7]|uniref:ATP-binding protein n=1 Tax=Bacillus sp. ISL-7 TaxID=2819136 RepID=UPI001BE81C1A|nr:ATP-binding protein [Bacillus sp. ISL-7]MBT2735325.1 ATP-binding protein [Bacillus sp. ISL-7]